VTQTLTIDGESYQVDRTVVGAIDEMQDEVEALRNVLWRLADFAHGSPCWCRNEGSMFTHTAVCRDALILWAKARV